MRKKLAAGNWKMNGLAKDLQQLQTLAETLSPSQDTDVLICPPVTLLHHAHEIASGTGVQIGAQDCHADIAGAYTGDISAAMIAETGANHVIVGHSERRDAHRERDSDVRGKARAAVGSGLTAIICIGESDEERASGKTLDVLAEQMAGSCPDAALSDDTVIAYEPIWAIGTGNVPSQDQIVEVHDFLREKLVARFGTNGNAFRLLYGGSVKASNAATIFAAGNVDGALVGGASLTAEDFLPIVQALQAS